jgi:hypothetical protein
MTDKAFKPPTEAAMAMTGNDQTAVTPDCDKPIGFCFIYRGAGGGWAGRKALSFKIAYYTFQYSSFKMIWIWGETLPSLDRGKMEKPGEHRRKSIHRTCRPNFYYLSGLCNGFRPAAKRTLKLSPAILRRVANPVEPFGFPFVQDRLPLSLPAGVGHCLRQRADLFDQLNDGPVNELQGVHDNCFAPAGR